jgi:hypothetical protein
MYVSGRGLWVTAVPCPRARFSFSFVRKALLAMSRTRDIYFSLIVDDFGVKYTKEEDVNHLIGVLGTKYKTHIDWSGTRFLGITLDWDPQRANFYAGLRHQSAQKIRIRFLAATSSITWGMGSTTVWRQATDGSCRQFSTTLR